MTPFVRWVRDLTISQSRWVFVWLFLPFLVILPSLGFLALLVMCCRLSESGSGKIACIQCVDGILWFTGWALGLVPGTVLIAYAQFKYMTRYFGDTREEAAEKYADVAEKLKALSAARIKRLVANFAVDKPSTELEKAKAEADEAEKNARAAPQDKELALKLKFLRDQHLMAQEAYNAAWRADWEAVEEEKAAQLAYDQAHMIAELAFEAAKKKLSLRAGSEEDAKKAKVDAAETANLAQRNLEEAKLKADAAKTAAEQAKRAADKATAAEAEAKKGEYAQKLRDAEVARAELLKAMQLAEDAREKFRSLQLNPNGLEQKTLDRAGKIREDEFRNLNGLAIVLVLTCWAAFTVCWGGSVATWLAVTSADDALRLSSLGAYIYVLMLLARRSFQRDITPASVVWCCVTLAVGPVLALVLAYLWKDSSNHDRFAPLTDAAIFFFAGLAPRHVTGLLLEMLRRALLALSGKPALVTRDVPLQRVRGVTPEVEERLEEEGIEDVHHLAMADPLRLLRNTSYDKFQILTWIDEALLIYTFPHHWEALEKEGITGVMDVAWYIACLTDAEPLAKQVKIEFETMKNIIQRLAEDAQVQLIWILYDLDNPNAS